MNGKTIKMWNKIVCALACAAALCVGAEEMPSVEKACSLAPQEHFGKIAQRLARMMPAYHVTHQEMDAVMSQRAWTNIVTMYDYNHMVFLQSDLDQFNELKTNYAERLRAGDVQFAYDLHKIFVRRLDECVTFATNLLERGKIDFAVEETYTFNRKDEAWPATVEARNDLWRKRIKNELLIQELGRELDDEEDAEAKKAGKLTKRMKNLKAAATNKVAQTTGTTTNAVASAEKPEPTPRETLLNKYRHYLAWVLTELDDEKVMERCLLAMTMAYDPHSGYMAPISKEDFDMDMSLSLCGVGAVLSQSMDDGSLEIKEIKAGSPIQKTGAIKEGDRIVAVGQGDNPLEDIVWKPMTKSIKKIRGPKNTKVVLEVTDKNGGSRRKVPIIRDEIKLEELAATGRVEKVTLDGVTRTMGYVKLPAFYGTMDKKPNDPGYRSCSLDVAKWVAKFNTQHTDGMILDLRGNGGGSLREAVLLTQLFVRASPMNPCPVVQIREQFKLSVLPTFPNQPSFAYRKPLIVLIDRGSASASEIVACALQDTGRALVVGDSQSHGKGTVQTLMGMGRQEYGSLKVTTARFYRINGSSTQIKGVASDIVLSSVADGRTDIGEGKLPNALPWTMIEPAQFDRQWNMPDYVAQLATNSAARVAKNEDWTKRRSIIKLVAESAERRTVPLGRAARKKWMKDDRAVFAAADDEELEDESDEVTFKKNDQKDEERARKRDIVLTEAMNILADLATLTKGAEPVDARKTAPRIPAWMRALQGGR